VVAEDPNPADSFEALLRKVAAAPEVALPLELSVGEIVDENFEIVERIGAGGMGVVYRARDHRLGRDVAIKLHVGHTDDRLETEAMAMARLSHPNVITVHEVGTYKDHLFIAMEFVEGDSARGWLDAAERGADEVLEVFAQAGRGLEAAHQAGLVHRDFKPDNIFIGDDGRVCVGDFGLARAEGEREPEAGGAPELSSGTQTGSVVGTLAYMAPEQLDGAAVDARADQFAFCASLWEALSGVRPFDADSVTSRVRSLAERRELPPLPDAVPRRIAAALRRGLANDPAERFPSMTELLEHIAPATRPSRAGWIAFAVATVAAAGAVIYAVNASSAAGDAGDSCAPVDPALGTIWSSERRQTIERAFVATDVKYAPVAWSAVSRLASDYATAIAADRQRACREAKSGAGLSTAMYQRRLTCLRRRERSLDSLLDILEDADTEVVSNAVDAAGALPPVSICGDERFLASEIEPPQDSASAAEAEDIRAVIGRATNLIRAGRLDAADAIFERALERARALDYAPVTAEALEWIGVLESRRDNHDASVKALRDGYFLARRVGADAQAGQLAARLAIHAGLTAADADDAALWSELAIIEVDRGGGSDSLELLVLEALGLIADFQGDFDRAIDSFERAHVLALNAYSADHPKVLGLLGRIAGSLHGKGELARAATMYERALVGLERSRGADHPDVGLMLRSAGLVNANRGETALARRQLERSVEVLGATLGPESVETGFAWLNLGVAFHAANDYRAAIERYDKALEIVSARLGAEHPDVSLCLNSLAVAHEGLREFDAAIGYLERALAIARTQGANHPQVVTVLGNIGSLLYEKGDHRGALEPLRAAITASDAADARSRKVAVPLTSLGESLVELRRYPEAVAPLERALELLDGAGYESWRTARAEFALARAVFGRDRARARALARSAERRFGEKPALNPGRLARVRAWLAANGADPT
jgi:tetratricopeptide (TPR) repeat protein/tRNA A-37 threonylcarbamoyl transferase component Bud32